MLISAWRNGGLNSIFLISDSIDLKKIYIYFSDNLANKQKGLLKFSKPFLDL